MPINVGGDDSVRWEVRVRNARFEDIVTRPKHSPTEGSGPYLNLGVDDTGRSPHDFTISVKIPRERGRSRAKADFAISLAAAAQQAVEALTNRKITTVSFKLPVEDRDHGGPNHEQIHIVWRPRVARKPRGKRRRRRGRR